MEIVGYFRYNVQFTLVEAAPIRGKANIQLVVQAVKSQYGYISRRLLSSEILEVHDFQYLWHLHLLISSARGAPYLIDGSTSRGPAWAGGTRSRHHSLRW